MTPENFTNAFELRMARLLDRGNPTSFPHAFVGKKLSCHLSEGWDARRFRDYVELMHKPGCRSGACKGCA